MLINKKEDGASYEECIHDQDFDCTLYGVTSETRFVENNIKILILGLS